MDQAQIEIQTEETPPIFPSASAIAEKYKKMVQQRTLIQRQLVEVDEGIFSFEKKRFENGEVSETEYRTLRDRQGDLRSQVLALDRFIEEIRLEGEKVLFDEIQADMERIRYERDELMSAKNEAIHGPVFDAMVSFFHEREKATGNAYYYPDDVFAIRSLMIGDVNEMDRRVREELSRLRGKQGAKHTIAKRLTEIALQERQIKNKHLPSFDSLVGAAGD